MSEITYGVDKGSPDGDVLGLTIRHDGNVLTYVGLKARAILALIEDSQARARADENFACQRIVQSTWSTNDQLKQMRDRIEVKP